MQEVPREPKVKLKKVKKERKENRGQTAKVKPRSRSRTPASQRTAQSQSSRVVESSAVEQGCLTMHDLLDVVLVDPTIHKEEEIGVTNSPLGNRGKPESSASMSKPFDQSCVASRQCWEGEG